MFSDILIRCSGFLFCSSFNMPSVRLMKRKWNEILEVMVSIYSMPSIFPFSSFSRESHPSPKCIFSRKTLLIDAPWNQLFVHYFTTNVKSKEFGEI